MARITNEQDYLKKRNEILDATQRLIQTKGYERMTISDIQEELGISSGAFYHYFDSKAAVLQGFINRISDETQASMRCIVSDPKSSAIEKLQRFFTELNTLRISHQQTVSELLRVWYTDENAIVRQKVDEAVFALREPLLTQIVLQGVEEQTFSTRDPNRVAGVVLSLLHGMENAHAVLLISLTNGSDQREGAQRLAAMEEVVSVYAAYMDAIERVLGMEFNALSRTDVASVQAWVQLLNKNKGETI